MRIRFSIGLKLAIGFGVLLLAIIVNAVITFRILGQSTDLNERISEVITPSTTKLKDLELLVVRSKALTITWLEDDNRIDDVAQKRELQNLYNQEYPKLKKEINELLRFWPDEKRIGLDSTMRNVDKLLDKQHEIMLKFKEPDDYYDPPSAVDERYSLKEAFDKEDGDLFKMVNDIKIQVVREIDVQEEDAKKASSEMNSHFDGLSNLIFALGAILSIVGFIVAVFTIRSIVRPVQNLRDNLLIMGKGVLPKKKMIVGGDEIGEMTSALNNLVDGLKSTSQFAKEIGEGNFEYDYDSLSENDTLGNSLLVMRENLKVVAVEDRKRNWSTEGVAKFGEVMRQNNDDVKTLSTSLISELITYLEANQGTVYVVDADKNVLKAEGCYAWDRIKVFEQEIEKGDGLVGQCWQENDTLYVNDVPKDYVTITSGLGTANPKCILIVPLAYNEEVFGVIEIASFNEFHPFEIQFVERIAETAAATIASVRVNDNTKILLSQSQEASEQLKHQEEELRLSQQELQKAQAEMEKKLEDNELQIVRLDRSNQKLREENQILQNVLLRTTKELENHRGEG
jgi:putative methionine-R-sulfoxide reductase with GAF domain